MKKYFIPLIFICIISTLNITEGFGKKTEYFGEFSLNKLYDEKFLVATLTAESFYPELKYYFTQAQIMSIISQSSIY